MNKTATRIPEAMFAAFNVVPDARDAALDGWSMNKLGEDLQINRLDMQARHGNAHQHGVLDGFAYGFGDARLQVRTLDAGIVVAGKPTGFPVPFDTPDLSYGVSTMLVNNLWGVNYVLWYPFETEDQNMKFRYELLFSDSQLWWLCCNQCLVIRACGDVVAITTLLTAAIHICYNCIAITNAGGREQGCGYSYGSGDRSGGTAEE